MLRLAHITDMHIASDPNAEVRGVHLRNSLRAVVDLASDESPAADIAILGGDLAEGHTREAYQFIRDEVLRLSLPTYWIPGNHDDIALLKETLIGQPISTDKRIIAEPWQIVLLDSTQHSAAIDDFDGLVSEEQLSYLDTCIADRPELNVAICLHHNLLADEARGIACGVINANEVLPHFTKHPQIKLILSGHIHQAWESTYKGIHFLSTPTTGFQSLTKDGEDSGDSAGYRTVELLPNGEFDTVVRRLPL